MKIINRRSLRSPKSLLLILCAVVLAFIIGCKIAPVQVIPQPRPVATAPAELPKIPPPDAAAAQVPPGYKVDVVLSGLTYPSSVEFDSSGNMYVAEAGYIYGDESAPARVLKVDANGKIEVVADQLNGPVTDLLWHQNKLFISHRGKVSVIENGSLRDIVTDLPSLGDHFNNQLAVGPDGKIYIGQGTASNSGIVGVDNFVFGWLGKYPELHDLSPTLLELNEVKFASLNPLKLSTEKEPLLTRTGPFQSFGKANDKEVMATPKANGTILRFNPDGSNLEVFAWGFRNPYGLAWSRDGRLFAADEGYDERGSRPIANAPDVLWLVKEGGWYGFPDFVAGMPVTEPQFKPAKAPAPQFLLKTHPPVEQPWLTLQGHSGVTQMEFSRSSSFGYEGHLFVAQVGDMQPITGNDARPAGFQVLQVDPQTGRPEVFFRARPDMLGPTYMEYVTTAGPKRPVDIRFSPDGDALYVADIGPIMVYPSPTPLPHSWPGSGVIWRISREGAPAQFPGGLTMTPSTIRTATGGTSTNQQVVTGSGQSQPEATKLAEAARPPGIEELISSWNPQSQEVAKTLIAKYGQPQEITPMRLTWHHNGPWKRTVVTSEQTPHNFPKPHSDIVEQTIDFRVPSDKVDNLLQFDGSIRFDRTRGEVSASGDSEEANFLAINLAQEIASGKRNVKDARQLFAEAILQKKHPDYKDRLRFFLPVSNQAEPDETYPLR